MFMNDVYKKEEIRNVAIQDLRSKFGIKHRPKKYKQTQEPRNGIKVFKRPLNSLPLETVTLLSGQQLIVPRILHQLCDFILKNADTEGLFRKGGSKSRQNEIKLLLDAGCYLNEDHHEIDVANVLKAFLRELPEPLIPYYFHDLFLRCTLLEARKTEAILLACLLLPTEHLNTLAYIMQFFRSITDHSILNKMDAYNLAVVIGPSVLPTEEKIAADTQQRLLRTCELFKVLIENANRIGILPENILERIASSNCSSSLSEDDFASKKKKKRRSGSLTRMFNGIKKMVGSKTNEDNTANVITPDLLLTPCIRKSVKKRRVEISNISAIKKREVLNSLPDGALRTPVMPGRTPVSADPDPRKTSPLTTCKPVTREKKKQWYSRGKVNKVDKTDDPTANTKHSQSTKSLLERRLSAVSQSSAFRRMKKRISCDAQLLIETPVDTAARSTDQGFAVEPDYVKISRSEYEEIKNRVSAIEHRISVELHSAGIEEDSDKSVDNAINNVQYVYQKTLVEAEPLSPSTDHIAKRLSRELKIRRSCDQKVHRSPSARKIGSLRRRSREREKQNVDLKRNQSWHVNPSRKVSPRTPVMPSNGALNIRTPPTYTPQNKTIRSSASFHGKLNGTASPSRNWNTVDDLFTHSGVSTISSDNSRTPLNKLRNQNTGLVMEKAKFFDGLSETRELRRNNKAVANRRIGTQRNQTTRLLKVDDNKSSGKKSLSPQKRKSRSPRQNKVEYDTEKENLGVNNVDASGKLMFSGLKECNRIETLGCNHNIVRGTPTIKRTLCTRTPKQLCRTPRIEAVKGCTPLKAKPVLKM